MGGSPEGIGAGALIAATGIAYTAPAVPGIAQLTAGFVGHGSDPAAATHQAVVAVALRVRQQANIMAFADTFALLGLALLIVLLASLLLRRPAPGQSTDADH